MKKWMKKLTSIMCSLCLAAVPASGMTANAATTVYGDVNNNDVVEIGDHILLNKYLLGITHSSNINMKYADVDKNAVLDVNDTKIILDSIVDLIPKLPYSESNATFDLPTSDYVVPADASRSYIKYDCATQKQSSYTLAKASAVSTQSGDYDDRVIDSSDNAQCIVRLRYKNSDGDICYDTGFIVDNHIIATCAHCLYDGTAFNTDFSITVYNAAGTKPVKTYTPSQLHIPVTYRHQPAYNDTAQKYDYGLIYVEEDLSAYGNMSLGIVTEGYINTAQTLHVSGFPRTSHGVNTTYRYVGTGNIINTTLPAQQDYVLQYTAYTSQGNSGGPVYIEYTLKGETFRSAIAINSSGVNGNDTTHWGIRITQPVLRFYNNNPNVG